MKPSLPNILITVFFDVKFQAVKDGLARVYLFRVPRESGCKPVTDIINKKCDVIRPSDSKEKVKVAVTGVGSNLFRSELEADLNIKYVDTKALFTRYIATAIFLSQQMGYVVYRC